jgi:hypothetical protein
MKENLSRYIFILVLAASLLLVAAGAFNAAVDPYGMYRLYEREGFNLGKPAIQQRVRLMKAYDVRRVEPQSIVLGTSRVHLGISPRYETWASLYDHRYNLAFDGATTKEMYAYLRHAHAAGRLEHVMLGLDTYHLLATPGTTRPDFDPGLLMNDNHGLNVLRALAADFKLFTSISTLKESFATIRAQDDSQPVWLSRDGQRLGEVFFRRPSENFVTCGPRCYFDEIDKLEVRFMLEWKIPVPPGPRAQSGPPEEPDPVTSLDYIQKIIDYCRRHNIRLSIFLTPSHVHQLELSAATGNWWSIENGKRKIVAMLARDAEIHSDKEPVVLYDFCGYSQITTEKLPPQGSKTEMKYYWDSSHFKENVGNMVLDRLLGTETEHQEIPGDFGVILRQDNVEAVIKRLRKAQEKYRQNNRQEIMTLQSWVDAFKEENGIMDD